MDIGNIAPSLKRLRHQAEQGSLVWSSQSGLSSKRFRTGNDSEGGGGGEGGQQALMVDRNPPGS